jgi:sugar phosphate isomerase/epimerase
VLEDVGWLLLAYLIAFLINLFPAFMPSTWMVLAFFRIQFGLPILPLTIGGAFFSGLGRIGLAKGTGMFHRRFFQRDADLEEMKAYLDERRDYVGAATFGYCLLPLPTNNLFVAAGVVGVNMARVMLGFWVGRSIADTFYVWTTDQVFSSLREVFEEFYSDWIVVVIQLLSLLGAMLLIVVPWPRWVLGRLNRRSQPR